MIQIYADGTLVYDSRLPGYDLLGLNLETGLNKGGAAYIRMPPGHPAFGAFTSYRTVVEIFYRNGGLSFRGRALYPSDDFLRCRTITCEGERCFLRDAVIRPYSLQGSPEAVFAEIVGQYNAQVEPCKQFTVGTVDVAVPDGIKVESDTAENADAVIDKLIDLCGGYIVFSSDSNGRRLIHWRAEIGTTCNQVIEFGENLLEYARTDEATDLATVIVPYGATNEKTGKRLTIESVNGGLDFIRDEDAVALRGSVAQAVFFDDAATPEDLLARARQYLAKSKLMITSLSLTAVDLSTLDRSIDGFRLGDYIRVKSAPHGVDEVFQLTARNFDLLHPENDRITLGKDTATLSGMTAAETKRGENSLRRVAGTAQSEAKKAQEAAETKIAQSDADLRKYVDETFAKLTALSAVSDTIATMGQSVAQLQASAFLLDVVTAVPSGADLNEYKTPGVYGVNTNAVAASLENCPADCAGTLRVINATGRTDTGGYFYLIQEFQPYEAARPLYRRTLTRNVGSPWSYGGWYKSAVTAVTT